MDILTKTQLAMTGDDSNKAQAIRLRAGRMLAGLDQKGLAAACNVANTAVNNMEMGRSYPSLPVMRYLYRGHRVDFNFLMNGDFAQLAGDVQEAIFPLLLTARNEWDQRESSGSRRTAAPTSQSTPSAAQT